MSTILKLTITHMRMYVRDRQSLFFALFFPLVLMLALGFLVGGGEADPIEIGVVETAPASTDTISSALEVDELLSIHRESEEKARAALEDGSRDAVLVLPESIALESDGQVPLTVLVNASDPQRANRVLALLQSRLVDVEHTIRGTQPLFSLEIQDVEARGLRYVDFLIPGILAFMVMQLAIAGSGFNIVEYKRKGILKRLFVTPLRPFEFIISLIASRLLIILVQITLLLLVAKFVFDISVQGSVPLMYFFVVLGGVLFLGLGFALGGVAKTQNAVMSFGNLVIFPQVFLAGVFFPIDSLPGWLQPVAEVLPLSYVSNTLRRVANEGATLTDLGADILGIVIWVAIAIFLATRLFKWGDEAQS